jgi:hypothetical protein
MKALPSACARACAGGDGIGLGARVKQQALPGRGAQFDRVMHAAIDRRKKSKAPCSKSGNGVRITRPAGW